MSMMTMPRPKLGEESQGQKENGGAGPSVTLQPEKNNEKEYRNCNFHIPQVALGRIFEKLDPKDKVTFSRAHDECHDLVASERAMFLAEEIAPSLVKPRPRKNIFIYRQLCRSWTHAVNRQLDENRMSDRIFLGYPEKRNRLISLTNAFRSSEAIQRFLEKMEEHPGNPFPGRKINFAWKVPTPENRDFDFNPVLREYWAHAFQLLRRFGSHVHIFTFTHEFQSNYSVTLETVAHNLRECLLLLPNLKQLDIFGGRRGYSGGEGLESYFRRNPLPRLHYLEEIAFDTHPTVIETVLSSCPVPANMKSLVDHDPSPDVLSRLPESVYNFINLEVLLAPMFTRDLQRLSSLDNVPPLRWLRLTFPRRESYVNPQLVFRALESFHNTLTEFMCRSNLSTMRNDDEWTASTCNLPNLRRLFLEGFQASLNPFVHFQSLTIFRVRNLHQWEPTVTPIVEHVQILKDKVYDSNIWRLIPSLRRVLVDNHEYTRYNYNKIRRAELEAAAAAANE